VYFLLTTGIIEYLVRGICVCSSSFGFSLRRKWSTWKMEGKGNLWPDIHCPEVLPFVPYSVRHHQHPPPDTYLFFTSRICPSPSFCFEFTPTSFSHKQLYKMFKTPNYPFARFSHCRGFRGHRAHQSGFFLPDRPLQAHPSNPRSALLNPGRHGTFRIPYICVSNFFKYFVGFSFFLLILMTGDIAGE
jgi:hypothetical protein